MKRATTGTSCTRSRIAEPARVGERWRSRPSLGTSRRGRRGARVLELGFGGYGGFLSGHARRYGARSSGSSSNPEVARWRPARSARRFRPGASAVSASSCRRRQWRRFRAGRRASRWRDFASNRRCIACFAKPGRAQAAFGPCEGRARARRRCLRSLSGKRPSIPAEPSAPCERRTEHRNRFVTVRPRRAALGTVFETTAARAPRRAGGGNVEVSLLATAETGAAVSDRHRPALLPFSRAHGDAPARGRGWRSNKKTVYGETSRQPALPRRALALDRRGPRSVML